MEGIARVLPNHSRKRPIEVTAQPEMTFAYLVESAINSSRPPQSDALSHDSSLPCCLSRLPFTRALHPKGTVHPHYCTLRVPKGNAPRKLLPAAAAGTDAASHTFMLSPAGWFAGVLFASRAACRQKAWKLSRPRSVSLSVSNVGPTQLGPIGSPRFYCQGFGPNRESSRAHELRHEFRPEFHRKWRRNGGEITARWLVETIGHKIQTVGRVGQTDSGGCTQAGWP